MFPPQATFARATAAPFTYRTALPVGPVLPGQLRVILTVMASFWNTGLTVNDWGVPRDPLVL